jgi:hypothetical protein
VINHATPEAIIVLFLNLREPVLQEPKGIRVIKQKVSSPLDGRGFFRWADMDEVNDRAKLLSD